MFELATIQRCPISGLGDILTPEEMAAWEIWLSEPRGDARADYQTAQICAMIDSIKYSFAGKPFPGRLDPYRLKFQKLTPQEIMARNINIMAGMFPNVIPSEVLDEYRDADGEPGT